MMRGQGSISLVGVIRAVGLVVSVGLLVPSSASALEHPFLGTFCEPTGLGTPPCEPSFVKAEGLAVDQESGNLLVIDAGASTVSRYNRDGTPAEFSALGANVIDGSETPQGSLGFGSPPEVQVAVDNSAGPTDGDIYVTQSSAHLIDIFGEDGSFLGQLTESSEGPFDEVCGVAVDPEGSVYVGEFGEPEGKIHKYEPAGSFPVNGDSVANFPFAELCTLAAGVGPTAGFIFPAPFEGPVSKLDSATGEVKYEVAPGENATETVDPATGHVYTASRNSVNEYDASGSLEATLLSSILKPGEVTGIAVDETTGNVYVARNGNPNIEVWGPAVTLPALPEAITEAATEVTPTEASLNGAVNPNELPLKSNPGEGCFFEYDTTEYEEGEGPHGETAPCEEPDAEEVGEGSTPVPVHADISGLHPGISYHFRLVAANANGSSEGEDEELLTLGPSIRGTSASQITTTGAKIGGEVNPRGQATSFEVQYVTESQFLASEYAEATAVPVPPRGVGSGTEFKEVVQQLSGLAPETTYHFRLVATNVVASNQGPDRKFTTFAQTQTPLPDGRAYEMVSPPQKVGEVFAPFPTRSLGGSCNNCLPGITEQMMPMQSAPDGEAVLYMGQPFSSGLAAGPNEYLSGRGASGWGAQSLSSPLFANGRGGTGQGYQAFSSDLSRGVVFQVEPALAAGAPIRGGESYANLYWRDEAGDLQPLVSEEPPNRDPGLGGANSFRIFFGGANSGTNTAPGFDHVVFEANDALIASSADAPAAVDGGVVMKEGRPANLNLYEWFEGELRLVNVAPGNATSAPGAVIGSGRLLAPKPLVEAVDIDHAISDDGSRIFWSEEEGGQVFVRIDGEETREIDDPGLFVTAAANGSQVLLSDGCLYDLESEECDDLTLDKASVHQGGFQGILGAAEDLSRVYFVDTKALTEESEVNSNGESAEEGELNLYAWQGGTTSFIGMLLSTDNKIGISEELGDWKASRSGRTAQVSADGRFLAFMSRARLTGYDNEARNGGECGAKECYEVFEYDAGSGSLSCASCNPSGQQPLGASNLSLIKGSPAFPPLREPGNLSADGRGRLFFESQDVLSPLDTNNQIQDVYEWEPNGVGSCERAGGCVFLISTGHSANDSMFLDSTPSGNDAFLVTRQQLLPRDEDQLLDLYDARAPHAPGEAVGFPEGKLGPCGGESCKGPVSGAPPPQDFASDEFSGSGNPPRPHKHHKKKHRKKRHHKRSTPHNRGGSR